MSNDPLPPESRPIGDVTVVMPAFNREHTIERALQSILRQTVQPREVIVVDDASSDDTVGTARRHGATVLTTVENAGSGPARNRGIEASRTTWVAFLDSDDEWLPEHLATLLEHSLGHVMVSSSGLTNTRQFIGNPLGRPLGLTARLVLESSELVVTSACMVSRDALVAAGLFRPLRRAQDLDMWVRLLAHGTGVAVPDPTLIYHFHEAQASLDSDLMLACFTEIVDSCSSEAWFEPRRDTVRAFSRIHWDRLRTAQRSRELPAARRELQWLAGHPHAWPPLARLLQIRRARRRATRAAALAPAL